jgi:hypothetical protein
MKGGKGMEYLIFIIVILIYIDIKKALKIICDEMIRIRSHCDVPRIDNKIYEEE